MAKVKKIKSKKRVIRNTKPKKHDKDLKQIFKTANISAIISAAIMLPAFLFGIVGKLGTMSIKILDIIFIIASLIVTFFVMFAYKKYALKHKFNFTKIMAFISIILAFILAIYSILVLFIGTAFFQTTLAMILLILSSVVYIIFGFSLFNLRKKAGELIFALAILYLIIGAVNAAVLLVGFNSFFGILFMIIPSFGISISIIEAIFFKKLIKDKAY